MAQVQVDTSIVNRQPTFDPSLTNTRSAYFLVWEKTIKDTLIYLRPKQYFTTNVRDTILKITLDSIVGSGTKRNTHYKAKYGKDSLYFRLPYTLVHDPNVSLDTEPVFKWTKLSSSDPTYYILQVATDSLFTTRAISDTINTDTSRHSMGRLKNGTLYYARIKVRGTATWSKLASFVTYDGVKFQFQDRFLIIEPVLITNVVNPLNRQVQLRVRYHKIPYF